MYLLAAPHGVEEKATTPRKDAYGPYRSFTSPGSFAHPNVRVNPSNGKRATAGTGEMNPDRQSPPPYRDPRHPPGAAAVWTQERRLPAVVR